MTRSTMVIPGVAAASTRNRRIGSSSATGQGIAVGFEVLTAATPF